jgi:hypothetical protein
MHELVIKNGAAKTGQHCDALARCEVDGEVTINLTGLRFVGPLFLVRLRAWLDLHDHFGTPVTVLLPQSEDVCRYMSRMHLDHDLGTNITMDLPSVRENPRGDRLIPLTKVIAETDNEFDDLLGDLLDSDDMRNAGYLAEVVDEAAQEMVLNATAHGQNPIGAYVAAQRFYDGSSASPHRCVLAIGDLGMGMAAHLQRGGQGQVNDAATIAHGMQDMVSGTGRDERGRGYSVPFEVAVQKEAAYVRLRVRANHGWVERRDGKAPRALLTARTPTMPGTWVEFELAHATAPPPP